MQSPPLFEPALVLLVQVLVAFLLLISYNLLKHSTGVRYKLWAISWIVYSVMGAVSVVIGDFGLDMTDSLATSGMLLGSVLLMDGANERERRGPSLLIYLVALIIGFSIVPIGMLLNASYSVVYTVIGIPSAVACWSSAIEFKRSTVRKSPGFWITFGGFLVWGVSVLLFIPFEMMNLLSYQVGLIATAVLTVGFGLFSHFIQDTTRNLRTQYQVSQLLESILTHDIRNYVGSLGQSIEQALASESDREMWLELASEIVESMTDFVMEMRYLSSTMARAESSRMPLKLAAILEDVSTRVIREYGLESNRIVVKLDEHESVISHPIMKEMLWNIFDNAFKHGTKDLTARASRNSEGKVVLEVLDGAGGIPAEVKEFLNNPDALSSPSAPGIGLGIILIRGLSSLCEIPLEVQDVIEDGEVVGSLFRLPLERAETVAASANS